MASNYPGSLDSFDTIASDKKASDAVGGRTHRDMHNDLGDAIESVQAELGVNPSGSAATVVARLDAAEGRIGNLLTANQASCGDTLGTAAGFDGWNGTPSYNPTYGVVLTKTAGSGTGCSIATWGANRVTVQAGATYTVFAEMNRMTSDAISASFMFVDSGDNIVGSSVTVVKATTAPGLSEGWGTAVAPPGAVRMQVDFWGSATSGVGATHAVSRFGVWRGSGGTWAMPGTPIPGTSRIAVNGAVDLSGTGSPEWVITAAPGSTWLQTDATTDAKGWIRWVKATGTGSTGWVAGAEANTGHRNIYASVVNGQVNDCRLRRYGNLVELTFGVTGYTNAAVAYTLPTGFRPSAGWMNSVTGTASVQTQVVARSGTGEVLFYGAGGAFSGYVTFFTGDPWPSSLPGSAA